ncbi:MAG: cohesin domain-containing protein [Acidobacteriota bacterium]|jgi:hypothetical protein
MSAARRHAATIGTFAALLLALTLPVACGKSPTTPRPTTTTTTTLPPNKVTFIADANPGSDAIALSMTESTATEFTLVLTVVSVTDLYGYAVDINFDPEVVAFDSSEAGDFLEAPGATVSTQVTEQPPGTLVIGQTRVGPFDGVSGSGTLLTLKFRSLAAGTSPFTPANASAFDSTGSTLATQFFGGIATVPAQPMR